MPPLAVSCVLLPSQMAVSGDTWAVNLPTEINTVSYATQPDVFLTVRMYSVVVLGVAVGLDFFASSKPVVGCHEYVFPAAAGTPI